MKQTNKKRKREKPKQVAERKRPSKTVSAESGRNPLQVTAQIVQPSNEATSRYNAIPLLFEESQAPESVPGRVVFDSWQQGPQVLLRDVTDGHLRRITLKAGTVSIELVAEKTRNCWEFVARVYSADRVSHDFVLKVGRRKLLSDSGGYIHWSSKLTPGQIELLSYNQNISFEKLSWR